MLLLSFSLLYPPSLFHYSCPLQPPLSSSCPLPPPLHPFLCCLHRLLFSFFYLSSISSSVSRFSVILLENCPT
jgi:hypothetical protein